MHGVFFLAIRLETFTLKINLVNLKVPMNLTFWIEFNVKALEETLLLLIQHPVKKRRLKLKSIR